MFGSPWLGTLYFIMALVVVLPGAFYLARKVPLGTKIIWVLIWASAFLAAMILYRYLSGFSAGDG